MMQKPKHWTGENAAAFQDAGVAMAYRHRPPYPAEVFATLADLVKGAPRHVLDVGCGTGNIARYLVEIVDRVDAVDISQAMIQEGQTLPNGHHPRLRWLHGPVETVDLDPPYGLIVAGESLHWMDWQVVLPRFQQFLLPGGYLAIVDHDVDPDPWSTLAEVLARYRTDGGYQPFDMLATLVQQGLFQQVGEQQTAPIPFVQPIDDYVESYHARSGFSRQRMGQERAAAFDEETRRLLLDRYEDGTIILSVRGRIVWGLPDRSRSCH